MQREYPSEAKCQFIQQQEFNHTSLKVHAPVSALRRTSDSKSLPPTQDRPIPIVLLESSLIPCGAEVSINESSPESVDLLLPFCCAAALPVPDVDLVWDLLVAGIGLLETMSWMAVSIASILSPIAFTEKIEVISVYD